MHHQVFGRKLNRDDKERKALFRSLVNALIMQEKIKTTVSKAKAIRGMAEKMVTLAKINSTATIRKLSSVLDHQDAIQKMMKEIAPRFTTRVGGYVRITRIGRRPGDNAEEVFIEWTVQPEKKEIKAPKGKKKAPAKKPEVKRAVKKEVKKAKPTKKEGKK